MLYGEFIRNSRWRDKLARKASHKSLNIPDEDMQINSSTSGITWKELLVIGTLLTGGTLGYGYLTGKGLPTIQERKITPSSPTLPHVDKDTDTILEWRLE
jgi:hypothetical protein